MFLKNHKKIFLIAIPIFLAVAVLFWPKISLALGGDLVDNLGTGLLFISNWLLTQVIYVAGQLLLAAIHILVTVSSFNDFVGANIVTIGWVIMRDVANMGIVIALLISAFNTVLNRQSYAYQKMLPKLVLAAILVNFSKEIAGLIIDLGQVVMMTFVHAFEDIAAGNLTYGFGLQDMLSVRDTIKNSGTAGVEINDWTLLGALALGVVMLLVALGVVLSMVIMLLARIVRLWLLIIFSPIAYVAGLLPTMEHYSKEWWSDFMKQITFGPTIAFLFWLSMTVISQITEGNRMMSLELQSQEYLATTGGSTADYAYFASQISSPQRIFDYMVTVALLIFCVITAKSAGVAGSEFAGGVYNKIQGAGKWLQRRPGAIGQKIGGGIKSGISRSKLAYGLQASKSKFLNDTKLGQKINKYTKAERDKSAEERKAQMFEKYGGVRGKGSVGKLQEERQMKKRSEMREKGELDYTQDELTEKFNAEVAKGKDANKEKLRIWMNEAARNDNLILTKEMKKGYEGLIDGNEKEEKAYEYHKKNNERMQDASTERVVNKSKTPQEMLDKRLNFVNTMIKEFEGATNEKDKKRLDKLVEQRKETEKQKEDMKKGIKIQHLKNRQDQNQTSSNQQQNKQFPPGTVLGPDGQPISST